MSDWMLAQRLAPGGESRTIFANVVSIGALHSPCCLSGSDNFEESA